MNEFKLNHNNIRNILQRVFKDKWNTWVITYDNFNKINKDLRDHSC